MRRFLAGYLMLAMLVGPWLCCCTASHLAGRKATPQPVNDSEPTRGASCCCCEHPQSRPDPNEPGNPEPASDHKCPCHQQGKELNALPVESDAGSRSVLSAEAPTELFPGFAVPVALSTHADGPGAIAKLPFVSTEELLRAFHFLRC